MRWAPTLFRVKLEQMLAVPGGLNIMDAVTTLAKEHYQLVEAIIMGEYYLRLMYQEFPSGVAPLPQYSSDNASSSTDPVPQISLRAQVSTGLLARRGLLPPPPAAAVNTGSKDAKAKEKRNFHKKQRH
jgi:hypothetical protein